MPDFSARRTTMVDTQVRPSDVTKFPIIDAMLRVPRENFVPDEMVEAAYAGETLDVGGRIMLEPRTFAKILDLLAIEPTDMVLDIGCGLGYSAAVLAHMADTVVAVEDDADRADTAQRLLSEYGIDTAAVIEGNLSDGAEKHGPYDAIIIEGGVEAVSDSLLDQLAEGGKIVAIFQMGQLGVVRIGQKRSGTVGWRDAFNATAQVLPGFERKREFQL